MWRLKNSLLGSVVYAGKKVTFSNYIRAQVKDVFIKNNSVSCGYITENTKAVFRSESSKVFLYIQISKEMFEFDQDGDVYYEKCVHGFLPELFHYWKGLNTNHIVSIVLPLGPLLSASNVIGSS
jgi:hypothetical protein